MRSTTRGLVILLVMLPAVLMRSGSADTAMAQTAPVLLGTIPGPSGRGLLVAGREAPIPELLASLREGGCEPAVLAQLAGGFWAVYVVGAPAMVNAAFPERLAALAPFFVLCGPNSLAGTVVDSAGQPIDGIIIALIMGPTRVDVTSGADGTWRTGLPASGGWTWSVVGALCTSRIFNPDCENESFFLRNPQGVVSVPGDPGPTVVYEIASRTIVGTTVNLAGGPIAGVRVRATRSDGASAFVSTDANGQFSVPAGPGMWTIWASFGELVSPTITIELGAAPTSAPLMLQLPLPGSGTGPLPPVGDGTVLTVTVSGISRAYDFRALVPHPGPTQGDFYFSGSQPAAFWANNFGQRGLLNLGAIATPLDQVVPPAVGYSRQGVPAVIGHIYVSLAREGFEGDHIIFRVLDIETDGTDVLSYEIEYVYRGGG